MRIALKSALMLVSRVIEVINPALSLHMQRTALISHQLALTIGLPPPQQKAIFCAALLHDIGVLADKRTFDSLHDIDHIYDPHQSQGDEMLEGLETFAPIRHIIRDHHFDVTHRGSTDQHIVYFADCFERMVPDDNITATAQRVEIIASFRTQRRSLDPLLCDNLCQLAENDAFWLHLNPRHIQRLLETIAPVNDTCIDSDGLKDVCLLIAKIVDTYSSFTASHSIMVGRVSYALAVYMQLPIDDCQKIEIAGYLHDIGKIYIPLTILEKQGKLSSTELLIVREHSYITGEILSDFGELGEIINWAANHHERLDSSGYPLHLNKEHLQLPDRIIAIADIFTALTEDRPYRPGLSCQEALQMIAADVDLGALDKQVYHILQQHAQTLYAVITQTVPP